MIQHGTYAALNRHKAEGSKPCDDCILAGQLYISRYRRRIDLGMPRKGHADERPHWTNRPELTEAALLGPILDAAWRANA